MYVKLYNYNNYNHIYIYICNETISDIFQVSFRNLWPWQAWVRANFPLAVRNQCSLELLCATQLGHRDLLQVPHRSKRNAMESVYGTLWNGKCVASILNLQLNKI